MYSYCSYAGCTRKAQPFSTITFFSLPKDNRRQIWIENSGNKDLYNIPPTAVRFFCQDHFDPKFLKKQFNRTILHRTAVPYKYRKNSRESIKENESDEKTDPTDVLQDASEEEDDKNVQRETDEYVYLSDSVINADIEQDTSDVIEELKKDEIEYIEEEPVVEEEPPERIKRVIQSIEHDNKQVAKKPRLASFETSNQTNKSRSSSYSEDEHFALSLVGYLQRLQPKQKALAKLKILSYLTELECENYD